MFYTKKTMQKISIFWRTLKKTFTSASYYQDVLKSPFSFSLKFFFCFIVLYALVATAFITVRYLAPLNRYIVNLPQLVQSLYPPELVITIKNGETSVNVPQPYAIPLEKVETIFDNWKQRQVLGAGTDTIKNLLVIDTAGSVDNFNRYSTYVLLTKTSISAKRNQNSIQTYPLDKNTNLIINQKVIATIVNRFTPYLNKALPILIAGTFLITLFFFPINRLAWLVLFALIIKLVSRLFSFVLTYQQSYQIGLHFIVVSTTITSLADLFLPRSIPFFETFIIAGLTILVARKLSQQSKNIPITP